MGNQIRFACTALAASNKSGVLKKDENGYYELVVGALNVFNSIGQYYVYDQARDLFEGSSTFMRRVKRGVLRGELGHPKPLPGMSEEQFAQRVMSIYEDNVCCHHKEIYLDFDRVKDDHGNPVIAIISRVYPSGPHGEQLRRSLDNPNENVCFSIRAFTDDFMERGTCKRILRTIVTWDQVLEPGLAAAEKFKAPALEGAHVGASDRNTQDFDHLFSRGQIERGIKRNSMYGVAQESAILTGQELFQAMGWDTTETEGAKKPAFLQW
jgi:hypothetical protein